MADGLGREVFLRGDQWFADGGNIAVKRNMSGVLTNAGTLQVTNGALRLIIYNVYDGGIARLVNAPED